MDSLSYLIENNNEIIIDQKLLHDLEKKQAPSQLSKNHSPKGTRKYSPMNRPTRKSPQANKVTKTETTKPSQQPDSRIFNEEQSIQILSAKIEGLKQGQRQMEEKYSEIILNLRGELNKRNTQYQRQCDQFNHVKNQLGTTKKDIASLISLLKQNTTKEVDNSKRLQSPGATKGLKGNILGYSKSNKDII